MAHVGRIARAILMAGSLVAASGAVAAEAQPSPEAGRAPVYGPYNAQFPAGGDGLTKPVNGPPPSGATAWSMSAWVQPSGLPPALAPIAGLGDPSAPGARYLGLDGARPVLIADGREALASAASLAPGAWRFVAAVCDGASTRLYIDGREVARGQAIAGPSASLVELAPRRSATDPDRYSGRLASFTLTERALSAAELQALASRPPDPALIAFETGSPDWPVQVHQMYGQVAPQDAWTLPKNHGDFAAPIAKPPPNLPALAPAADDGLTVNGWRLAEAPKVADGGAVLSRPGYDARSWYVATVPGTVLTTLVDRGVYPDPEYGLDNLKIPESLNKQDYWYRTEFDAPAELSGRHLWLTFNGINYAAEVWLNGQRLGTMKGAFVRGRFDVTALLRPGAPNALAVKVSPPPHPGLAQEESLTAGPGENGGMEALDGPTFIDTEGWDWIPSVRDRDTGIWQDVVLSATGSVRFGDAQVVTTLPRPDNSEADVEIDAPIENLTAATIQAKVRAAFDDVSVEKTIKLAPGETRVVRLDAAEFPALAVRNPKLWWPNGYGAPALHTLHLSVGAGGAVSDHKDVRFGMRQITYELSMMDSTGHLRRVEIDPSKARQLGQQIVDVRHQAIRKIPGGWVTSLTPGAETSPAVREVSDIRLTPYLIIKVNGVRIAARGGNWGMDDWMKRVSKDRLEPYFRLHRDAHLNIIRNWVGQNTEEAFYDLADEYGLLILNDFWESTQDYNLEAEDPQLFLNNAAEVLARYRNHPSIAVWFGRNEGVPQPVLNEGLARLIRQMDGTRYYTPSSNRINLQNSGPYNYREPATYFTEHAKGFSVESGTPSFPTLEAFEAVVPPADRWPISDTWAYHDWHQGGNGDVKTFMQAMDEEFGPPASLQDFARKAQMMNYVTHRAMFEGFNAQLWNQTSGRLLWMTQPAWPSTMWQILSHDYDTHAAFYGVEKACEPIHVQMNLPDYRLAVIDTTRAPISGATLRARVYSLDSRLLLDRREAVNVPADTVAAGPKLDLEPLLASNGVVFVKLELRDASGRLLSDNFYWQGANRAAYRRLDDLKPASISVSAADIPAGGERRITVRLSNTGNVAALETKLTLLDAQGRRVLPAYYSDNYVSLLPGETREVQVAYPAGQPAARLGVRGWNLVSSTVPVWSLH